MARADKKEKKEKKKKQKEELDMETTVADMNVEGFKWYAPHKKKNKESLGKITFKEFLAMVIGAFRAFWPILLMIVLGFGMMVALAYMWLR